MKLRSKTVLKKLWPGKPILQALFITKKGSEIQLETMLPPKMFEEILARVTNYMGGISETRSNVTSYSPGCEECGAGPGEEGDPEGSEPCKTCGTSEATVGCTPDVNFLDFKGPDE